jgi:hypothetical protein
MDNDWWTVARAALAPLLDRLSGEDAIAALRRMCEEPNEARALPILAGWIAGCVQRRDDEEAWS